MVKIGKNLLHVSIVCVFFVMLSAHADALQLRVVSPQGTPLKKVAVGMPSLVELVVPGTIEVKQRLTIPGLDPQAVVRTQESSQIYIVNGVQRKEKTFGYMVTFQQPGTVTLGPVKIVTPQGELVSNIVTFQVEEMVAAAPGEHAVFAAWQFAKKSAYVGEGIPYSLKFYYTDDAISRIEPVPFSLPDVRLVVQEAGVGSLETIRGSSYRVREWRGVLYVNKAGELIVPPVMFEYLEPQQQHEQRFAWAQLMQMMGSGLSPKQVQAPGKKINIKALPHYEGQVNGVGIITQARSELITLKAAAGAPVTYTISVTGNADMEGLAAPQLMIPDTVKAYFSRAMVTEPTTSGMQTKTWEYVVQGLAAGVQTIPEQQLVFFNPEREQYELFKTQPAALEITGTIEEKSEPVVPAIEVVVEKLDKPQELPAEIQHALSFSQTGELPWHWFLMLMLLPVLLRWQKNRIYSYYKAWRAYIQQRLLLRRVRKKLPGASAYVAFNSLQKLTYAVFGSKHVNAECLKARGFSDVEVAAWYNSWDALTAAAFSANNRPDLQAGMGMVNMLAICIRAPWRV